MANLPAPQLFEPPDQDPITLAFGEWKPDQPDYNNDGSPELLNVLVQSSKSFGPMSQFAPITGTGLLRRAQGGAGFLDASGASHLFAGDQKDLYQLTNASTSFSIVSQGSHPYHVANADYWRFTYFNGLVIAGQLGDNLQSFTLASATAFVDLGGTPPKAKYLANIKDAFLMLAFTNDGADNPQRVWWSGAGDATNWPTPGGAAAAAVQSGFVNLYNNLGNIQGLVGGLANADGAVFFEHGVRRIEYVGPSAIFDFSPCEGVRGTPAPGSICMVPGGLSFYYSEDGFRDFDGASSNMIGLDKVDQYFAANCPQQWLYRLIGVVDPISKNVFWTFPDYTSPDGTPTQTLVYNYAYGRWTHLSIGFQFLAQFIGIGYTLDQLYTLFGYTVDGVPFPFDSNVWIGGRYSMGVFDSNNKLNFATGAAMAASMMTKELEVYAGKRSLFRGGRVIMEGGSPALSIGKRDSMENPPTYSLATARNSFGTNPGRASGRYLRALVTTAAGATWRQAQGVELDITEQKGSR